MRMYANTDADLCTSLLDSLTLSSISLPIPIGVLSLPILSLSLPLSLPPSLARSLAPSLAPSLPRSLAPSLYLSDPSNSGCIR